MEKIKLFVAVKACVLNEKNEVLILRESPNYKDGTNISLYDVPGGRIDPAEDLLDALRREVFEETGLTVISSEIVDAHDTFNNKNDEVWHIVRLYYKVTCEPSEIILSKDHDTYEWVKPTDAKYRKDIIQNLPATFMKLI